MKLLNKKSDQQLVQAYVKGEERAIQVLLERYKTKIYTSIYHQVKDQYLAEDIFQQTLTKVINTLKAGRYNNEGKFLRWVMRIAHNMVNDHFRREKRAPNLVNNDGVDIFEVLQFSDDSVETKMLKTQRDIDLKKIIQLLPDDQKEVLIMRLFCD